MSLRRCINLTLALLALFFWAALISPERAGAVGAQLVLSPVTSVTSVGNNVVVTIYLNDVADIYGYQFQVSYDANIVSASASFLDTFFNRSTNAFSPPRVGCFM